MFLTILLLTILLLFLGLLIFCYRKVFWVRRGATLDLMDIPGWDPADPQLEGLRRMIRSADAIPCRFVSTVSHDGLTLWARYYEIEPGAPVQLLFHGYRSNAVRDFSGGLQLALDCRCNVLLVDQRAHGRSEGSCLSFGVLERRDCLTWVEYARKQFGDVPMFLVGMSMGAATVMMASGLELPECVKGIIADCGYTSPRKIIQKVMTDLHYPLWLYPFIRLSALVFGRFDPDSCGAETELKKSKVPVLFIHGTADSFVPVEMTQENYAACASEKYKLLVPGAVHGLSYVVDTPLYRSTVSRFLRHCLYRGEQA